MFHFFFSLILFAPLFYCGTILHALDSDRSIVNNCNVQFPKVTEQRVANVIDLGNKIVESANRRNAQECRGLFQAVQREVENMLDAQVQIEAFVNNAFYQAELQGAKFSDRLKDSARKMFLSVKSSEIGFQRGRVIFPDEDITTLPEIGFEDGLLIFLEEEIATFPEIGSENRLLIFPDEDIATLMYYREYPSDLDLVQVPLEIELGINLVVVGQVMTAVPNVACSSTGAWIKKIGLGLMATSGYKYSENVWDNRPQDPIAVKWH